jgi:hypothetical protein
MEIIKKNEFLTSKILDNIPQSIKSINYLIDKLNISRESAYRRLRGDIPYSFEEITNLSLDLGFSVDEVIGMSNGKRIFFDLQTDRSANPEESFLAMFVEYSKFVDIAKMAENVEIFISNNRINLFLLAKYDFLFKLYYYKWIHQTSCVSINKSFSEITVPEEIMSIRNEFLPKLINFTRANFIIDRDIFLTLVREIQYYYNRKLISDVEIILLKQELLELLNSMELLMQLGINENGSTYNFYLSLLDVETNTINISYDNNMASLYWLYSANAVVIKNQEICFMHKKWLESLKKYSVLITQSNEILQAEFLNKQREYIENINNDLFYYS